MCNTTTADYGLVFVRTEGHIYTDVNKVGCVLHIRPDGSQAIVGATVHTEGDTELYSGLDAGMTMMDRICTELFGVTLQDDPDVVAPWREIAPCTFRKVLHLKPEDRVAMAQALEKNIPAEWGQLKLVFCDASELENLKKTAASQLTPEEDAFLAALFEELDNTSIADYPRPVVAYVSSSVS